MAGKSFILIEENDWIMFTEVQQQILSLIRDSMRSKAPSAIGTNITAKEFMDAVRIKRTKFDQLVQTNRIKIIKKKRKI